MFMSTYKWRQEHKKEMAEYRRKWYREHKKQYYERLVEYRKRKRKWMENLKSRLVCENCGASHISFLVFHHIDPKKKDINLGNVANACWSEKRILKEMEKCKVFCSNCHLKFHWEERQRLEDTKD